MTGGDLSAGENDAAGADGPVRLGLWGWVLALAAVGIVAAGGYTLYSGVGDDDAVTDSDLDDDSAVTASDRVDGDSVVTDSDRVDGDSVVTASDRVDGDSVVRQ